MTVWFPIAEIALNLPLVFLIALLAGITSGLFGVGGGFLMTPFLIFTGVPPAVAVGTQASQLVASSFSGYLAQRRKKQVDSIMAMMLFVGGLLGSAMGLELFRILKEMGQIDAAIALSYVLFLGTIGGLMLMETFKRLRQQGTESQLSRRKVPSIILWLRHWPLRMRFPKSKIYISGFLPILIGIAVGGLVAIMGIGGGFLMIPAMIYILGMPAQVVIGTSLLQITLLSVVVTMVHAVRHDTVDLLLALPLIIGSSIGAQLGARLGAKFKHEQLRLVLALVMLGIASKMFLSLVLPPANPFSLEVYAP
jgi:uncharacterized protein